jgi:hypothetical protein
MQHPIDQHRAETFEVLTVTDPVERDRLFFQFDHVRVYSRDFPDRLRSAGLSVTEEVRYSNQLAPEERVRFLLDQHPSNRPHRDLEADQILVCSRQISVS